MVGSGFGLPTGSQRVPNSLLAGLDQVPMSHSASPLWLFGYGSLIWRPDFDFLERAPATLNGYARRFWQGSHDHRGTPQAPGRVVTLVDAPGEQCGGMAYRMDPQTADRVLSQLDHREKNGYERLEEAVLLRTGTQVTAVVYRALPGNFAWLGDDSHDQLARQIAASAGPSGRNRDYLFELHAALTALEENDPHVAALAATVRKLTEPETPA